MKTKLLIILALFTAALAPLHAQLLLADTAGTGFTTGYGGSYNIGYQFTVGDRALSVTSLGFYDAGSDGLVDNHQVGLWRTDGNLLASVQIGSGLHSLINGFAFDSLFTPVLLDAHTDYILSAFWPTPQDPVQADFFAGSQPQLNGATLVGSRLSPLITTTGFSFPNGPFSANGFAWIGANLIYTPVEAAPVPEPSTYALWGALMVLGLGVRRSIKTRQNKA